MQLAPIDWVIMAAFFAVSLAIGLSVSRKAGQDFSSFFLGGQRMPWWLLGVSMVATTFSTDTPNLVADIVRSDGTFGNWTWWAFLLTGMLTVFLYAKLWRRSGVFTDVEFYELRYSGKLAAFLRGFRAAYLGILFNVIIMASVTLAAIKIGGVMLGLTPLETVVIAATVTMIYSALGGLTGVLLTDLIQFGMAMAGSIGAAYYILNLPDVGGLQAMLQHENVTGSLAFWPQFETMTWQEMLPMFFVPLAVQWWASYYPGAEPGGGGYLVQRMLAAKDEKNAVGATLLFNGMHYALRPWPWILVALASLIVFPDLDAIAQRFPAITPDKLGQDLAYPAMLTFLPAGLLGLVVTSLAAAYMSTMSTQVNWGSSIVVNDLYQRFINPEATEKQLVWMGRWCTVGLMVTACALALLLQNALQVFNLILLIGAGTGLLFLLRWFWWRINAATEIVAMVVSFVFAVFFQFAVEMPSWAEFVLVVALTTAAWVTVAYTTRPTDEAVLLRFYEKIRPGGPGWRPVAAKASDLDGQAPSDLPYGIASAACGALGIYSVLFATGFFLYGRPGLGLVFAVLASVMLFAIIKLWPKLQFGPSEAVAAPDVTHPDETPPAPAAR